MAKYLRVSVGMVAVLLGTADLHGQRVPIGLLNYYEFNEGSGDMVTDTSGFGDPMDMMILDPANTAWGNGFLTINSPTQIFSPDAATKIFNAVTASEEITVEAWVLPANNTATGPARLVNLSSPVPADSPTNRNFTLGQDTENIQWRFRTTVTGANGVNPAPNTNVSGPAVLSPPELIHVVATRAADGTSLVYVDGELRSDPSVMQGGNTSNWDPSYQLSLAHEFQDPTIDNRAFLGEYHLVAIYDRALSESAIGLNFSAGPEGDFLTVGDFDFNGSIDLDDFTTLKDNFFSTEAEYQDGDADFDGDVDLRDFVIFREAFHTGNPAAVPEPSTLVLLVSALGIAAAFCLGNRCRA